PAFLQAYGFLPSIEEFKMAYKEPLIKGACFMARDNFDLSSNDPDKIESVAEQATQMGLGEYVQDGKYTGPEELFWSTYDNIVRNTVESMDEEAWQAEYENTFDPDSQITSNQPIRDGRIEITGPL